jgi:hypothetical protein
MIPPASCRTSLSAGRPIISKSSRPTASGIVTPVPCNNGYCTGSVLMGKETTGRFAGRTRVISSRTHFVAMRARELLVQARICGHASRFAGRTRVISSSTHLWLPAREYLFKHAFVAMPRREENILYQCLGLPLLWIIPRDGVPILPYTPLGVALRRSVFSESPGSQPPRRAFANGVFIAQIVHLENFDSVSSGQCCSSIKMRAPSGILMHCGM